MGQTSDQIAQEITETRGRLERSLEAIEGRVKHEVNWRTQIEKRPFAVLGTAAAGGLLLAMWTTGRSSNPSPKHPSNDGGRARSFAENPAVSAQSSRLNKTFDTFLAALIGIGAGKVEGWLENLLPGFRDEYRRAEKRDGRSDAHTG